MHVCVPVWSFYPKQEQKMNTFLPSFLCDILGMKWQDQVFYTFQNAQDQSKCSLSCLSDDADGLLMFTSWEVSINLRQQCCQTRGSVEDFRVSLPHLPQGIPAVQPVECPHLCYKDLLKLDVKLFVFDPNTQPKRKTLRSSGLRQQRIGGPQFATPLNYCSLPFAHHTTYV